MQTLALCLAALLAPAQIDHAAAPQTDAVPQPAAPAAAPGAQLPNSAERAYLKAVHTRTAAWVLLGVGVATLGTGAGLYGASLAQYDDLSRDLAAFNAASQAGAATATAAQKEALEARSQRWKALQLSGTWLGVFGVGTLAASLVTFLVGEDPAGIRPLGREPSAVEWSLSASPWELGLAARF